MTAVDLRLYAILDPAVAGGRTLPELARLIAPCATLVQLRDKTSETRAFVDQARAIHAVLKPAGVPVLINDRVDVALAAGVEGVHIGQTDMAPEDARRLLGPGAVIGLTIQNAAQADAAPLGLLDYVAFGGVYGTTSKETKKAPIGVDGVRALTERTRARVPGYPVCAIAGITAKNAADVIGAGADGVSVISALSLAPDPAAAARDLREAVDGALTLARRA